MLSKIERSILGIALSGVMIVSSAMGGSIYVRAENLKSDVPKQTNMDEKVAEKEQVRKLKTAKVAQNDIQYRVLDEATKTCVITNYTGKEAVINIPDVIDGYEVTQIGYHAFYNHNELTEISLPRALKTIEICAFEDCGNLVTVVIPENVSLIDSSAFDGCRKLQEINVKDGNANYISKEGILYNKDYSTIVRCPEGNKQSSIVLPESTIHIDDYAFMNVDSLTSVTLPNGLTSIGDRAFYRSYGLHNIKIPDTVNSIGYDAFTYSTRLVLNGGTYAEQYAKDNSRYYDYIEYISGNYTYGIVDINKKYCTIMKCDDMSSSIDVPEKIDGYTVMRVDTDAFSNKPLLTAVKLPDTITEIKESAFENCSNLEKINLPSKVTTIEYAAFSGCKGMNVLELPQTLTSIGGWAFAGWNGLTSVDIPGKVDSLGEKYYGYPFENCNNLAAINVDVNNSTYSSQDGILYNKNKTDCIKCPLGKKGNIIILDSVTNICEEAFKECKKITGIEMSDLVVTIGNEAFKDCEILKDITMSGILTQMGYNVFENCVMLNKITLPQSLETIGGNAFSNCRSLTSIFVPKNVKDLGYFTFSGCKNIETISVDAENVNYTATDNVLFTKNKDELLFCAKTKPGDYVVPESVTYIYSDAFNDCRYITSISFPGKVSMSSDWFENGLRGCDSLQKINISPDNTVCSSEDGIVFDKSKTLLVRFPTGRVGDYVIPETVDGLDMYAFNGCTKLDSVTINSKIDDLVEVMFEYSSIQDINVDSNNPKFSSKNGMVFNKDESRLRICPNGKSGEVTIPSTVTDICYGAFINCKKISNVQLPQSIRNIDDYAFKNCEFQEIHLPEGLETIGWEAFYNNKLTSITIPSTVQTMSYCGLGYINNNGRKIPVPGFIVRGVKGTEAERYAVDNGFKFEEVKPEEPKFDFSGTSMTMGNDLNLNFYVDKATLNGRQDVYAQVTQEYSDERLAKDVKIEFEKWVQKPNHFVIPFDGLAAKEMNDKVTVRIMDHNGNVLSTPRIDSIHDYALRMLERKETNAKLKTCFVDMLNYGAEAQKQFNYDVGNPANKDIDAYQDFATKDVVLKDTRVKGTNYYGTSLSLKTNIRLGMYFTNIDQAKYAMIKYTNHHKDVVEYKIDAGQFIQKNSSAGKYTVINIDKLLVSDVSQPVTCEVYDASDNLIGCATDSVESYCARMKDKGSLYIPVMKFGVSARDYFNNR